MKQTMTTLNNNTFAAVLNEGFLKAKTIKKQQNEICHLRNSKRLIRKRQGENEHEVKRLKSTIRSLEVKAANTKQELQHTNAEVVKRLSSQLSTASDIINTLDPNFFDPELLSPHEMLDMKPFEDKMDSLEEECKKILANKLDVIPHAKDLFTKVHQTEEILMSNLSKAEIEFDGSLKQMEVEAKSYELDFKHWSSEENIKNLVDECLRKLLGQRSNAEERMFLKTNDIEALVKKSLCDHIGELFVAEMIREPSKKLYPSVVNSLQVRDTADHPVKITEPHPSKVRENLKRLSKDSEDLLLSMQELLDSTALTETFNHLGHLDKVISNHAKVLSFLNAPDGHKNTEIYMGDYEEAGNIPPEISLYQQDVHITNALRASITQYTDNWFFSNISRRVEALEKKVCNDETHLQY